MSPLLKSTLTFPKLPAREPDDADLSVLIKNPHEDADTMAMEIGLNIWDALVVGRNLNVMAVALTVEIAQNMEVVLAVEIARIVKVVLVEVAQNLRDHQKTSNLNPGRDLLVHSPRVVVPRQAQKDAVVAKEKAGAETTAAVTKLSPLLRNILASLSQGS